MPGLVEQCCCEVFRRREALVELAGRQHLVHQRLRHRLARLVVLRIIGQHARIRRPHFVVLRRVLDEVARHARAGEARILHVREQAVQRMAEFMECGRHFIERQQRRLTLSAASEC